MNFTDKQENTLFCLFIKKNIENHLRLRYWEERAGINIHELHAKRLEFSTVLRKQQGTLYMNCKIKASASDDENNSVL